MKKFIGVIVGLVVVLFVGKVIMTLASHKDDKQQIQEALHESIKASKEGRPGGVLDLLSSKVKFNDQDAGGSLGQVAEFIKKQRPDVTIDDEDPTVNGGEARITSPVDLTLSFLGQSKTIHLKNVVLLFHKVPSHELLIIPTTKWELTDVQAPDAPEPDFAQ